MTGPTDIVERLRVWRRSEFGQSPPGYMFEEAADTIEALRASLAEAKAAFKHYGEHKRYCNLLQLTEPCTCGYSAALANMGNEK